MKLLLRNLFVSCVAMWALLILAGCATTDGPSPEGASGMVPFDSTNIVNSAVIRPGEQLTIELLDIAPATKVEQAVADDGTITLPLLSERIQAAGKKVAELQDHIRELYISKKFYKRMTVNIKRENRYYFVRGQVKSPRQAPWTGDIRLSGAISAAGDFTDYADKKNIEIIRSNGVKVKVNWKNVLKTPNKWDLPIYPGDTVHVPLSIY
jgi:polysaccharide biosynthesis/export protein VpsN